MTFNLTKQTLASSISLTLMLSASSAMAENTTNPVDEDFVNYQYSFSEKTYGTHSKISKRNVEEKALNLNMKTNITYEGAICSFEFAQGAGFDVNFGNVKLDNSQENTIRLQDTALSFTGLGCDMAFFNIENTSVNQKNSQEGRKPHPVNDASWNDNGHTWYALGDDIGVWFTTVIKEKNTVVTAARDSGGKRGIKIENGKKINKAGETAQWLRLKNYAEADTITLTSVMNIDHRKYAIWNHTENKEVEKVMSFTAKIQ
ncbi:hypothetical protein VSAK1_09793 [Vibrio mediterranei AK1]|uniref:hypothetical protein n=1 Tax=Vibrio mediterranei TaxID=689 RepID=UPI000154170C|nr:hypothetical protein [Vibrio mediterranei]EDL53945.1 hypothetical protein VSAK1_09793 [Vibrio mediterranei AK1]